jgi:hypothetical protein
MLRPFFFIYTHEVRGQCPKGVHELKGWGGRFRDWHPCISIGGLFCANRGFYIFTAFGLGTSSVDPLDPYVFGPPGSGSVSQRYWSGSFYHQAKIVRKTLIPTVLWLLLAFLSLKNDVNVRSKSNKQKNLFLNLFFVGALKVNDENSRILIWIH